MSNTPKYVELNNAIMTRDAEGTIQFGKDAAAANSYFLDYVNQNTVFFHSLREKLDYLLENDYYEADVLDRYTFDEIKAVYQAAYSYKFRFQSFMSAFKFYNDYALKTNDGAKILERYEDRVAIVALFFGNGDAAKALDYAGLMMRQEFQPATPTFLNAGRQRRGELVSCFLLEVGDSLNDINMAESTAKQLSKIGGGVALNLSKVRAKGESIKGIENVTKGVVGVMKMLDNAFRYADQQGQRPGSGAAYLTVFHADIHAFLDTKKISADDDVRVKTLSIGVVIPDKFIELAREDRTAYVFYPHTVYKAYGQHLDEMDMDEMYDVLVDDPRVRKDVIKPRQLLEKLASVRLESGYPYIMFAGNVNKVHALEGTVKFSNLCSEILQRSEVSSYTDYGEEDVLGYDISCNLGSLNIANVMRHKTIGDSVGLSVDALTRVVDFTNVTNAPAVAKANREMRSIGLGAMNLHGYLAQNGIAYESAEAIDFANVFFAAVNFHTLRRSMEIARDTGETFRGFKESAYSDGTYFADYYDLETGFLPQTPKVAALFADVELPTLADWMALADDIIDHGLYHSYRLAIAPTGSISYVQSATASVMPIMERIEERTYGNSKTYYPMPGLSPKTWFLYKEAYDMDMFKVVDLIATIQRHVDQGISFTLFLRDTVTTRDINRIDLYAHHKGIKTLYYARTKDTTQDDCLSCTV
ncbi:class 1b ribonucleoside-diphosphate reductase subunit alpha [uncultured Planococcus sp.]|uniref:class 1b ribonucleoside-diphosphate reductase subunit alpha n=1 Tax=uncultured Planococcus sp. TaxID=337815 RepID=UPI002615FB70|nr:class 1b ribonucleoside-diphosphate reductase subunit alpha [uncultured Planococcus sp.]